MIAVAALEAGGVALLASAGGLLEVLGSVASLGVAASLGRSLGSGTSLSGAVVSGAVVLLEVAALLAGAEGVTARGVNLSGVRKLAGGCGALSEALGTRIGTAWIGSRATLSWLADERVKKTYAPKAIIARQKASTSKSLSAMSLMRIRPSAEWLFFAF